MILDANLILADRVAAASVATNVINFKKAGMRNLNKMRTLSVVGDVEGATVVVYGTDAEDPDNSDLVAASAQWTPVFTGDAPVNYSLDQFGYKFLKVAVVPETGATNCLKVSAFVHANDVPVEKTEY